MFPNTTPKVCPWNIKISWNLFPRWSKWLPLFKRCTEITKCCNVMDHGSLSTRSTNVCMLVQQSAVLYLHRGRIKCHRCYKKCCHPESCYGFGVVSRILIIFWRSGCWPSKIPCSPIEHCYEQVLWWMLEQACQNNRDTRNCRCRKLE